MSAAELIHSDAALAPVPPSAPENLAFRRAPSGLNVATLAGGAFVLVGGLLYASAEMAYASLAGATDFLSYGWIYDVYGFAFLLLGFGILLGFVGLSGGWPALGGGVAFFGTILIAISDAAYAALRGRVIGLDLLWTSQLDAVGFLFLAIGLMIAFAGLAMVLPRGMSQFLSGDPLR